MTYIHPGVTVGDRVRVNDHPFGVTLRSPFGMVIGKDTRWDEFVLVQLDEPYIYHSPHGVNIDLWVLREHPDNLRIIDDATPPVPATPARPDPAAR